MILIDLWRGNLEKFEGEFGEELEDGFEAEFDEELEKEFEGGL